MRIIGADELVREANLAAEVDCPGLLRKKRIGTSLDEASIHPLGEQNAAETRAAFEQRVLQRNAGGAFLFESKGSGESRNAATDYGNAFHEITCNAGKA